LFFGGGDRGGEGGSGDSGCRRRSGGRGLRLREFQIKCGGGDRKRG
jgi:hypothetical protein